MFTASQFNWQNHTANKDIKYLCNKKKPRLIAIG